MPTVEISRIHTTLEISLLLQTKVTEIAVTRCVFWALMTEMRLRQRLLQSASSPLGELTVKIGKISTQQCQLVK